MVGTISRIPSIRQSKQH